jgi:hypothetical protein
MSIHSGKATHYDVLQVSSSAPEEVIKAAYKALAKIYHPDTGVRGNHLRMVQINLAHEVLTNSSKKWAYDRSLYVPILQPEPPAGPPNPSTPTSQSRDKSRTSPKPFWSEVLNVKSRALLACSRRIDKPLFRIIWWLVVIAGFFILAVIAFEVASWFAPVLWQGLVHLGRFVLEVIKVILGIIGLVLGLVLLLMLG